MRLKGLNSFTVSAEAVAGDDVGDTCIWVLASSGTGLDVQGSYNIDSATCGIYVNSTSSNVVKVTGNGGTVDAAYLDSVGSSVGHETNPTPITTGIAPQNDPWSNVSAPSTSVCTSGNTYTGTTFTSTSP